VIRRINLYIFSQVLIAFLFSGIAVTFVVLFTQSFRMLSFVIDNSSTMVVFFQLMGLLIPTFLPLIVPISLGVAVLFIYHKFVVDSEMVVMRAAGMSPMHLALPALILAGMVVMAGYGFTIWVTPMANRSLVTLQYKVRDDFSAFMIRPGAFNDLAEGLTFYARTRAQGGGFEDILVHDVRDPAQPVTIMAEKGLFYIENSEPQFVVFNGRRQAVNVETGRLQELNFDRYVFDLHLLRNNGATRALDPREMTVNELWAASMSKTSEKNAALKGNVRSELHQRLGGPLLSLTFAVIAVAVILAGDFNRRGMSRRVIGATIAIVVVQAAMISLVSQVAKSAWIIPVLYLVILSPVPLCLYLLDAPRALALLPRLFRRKGTAA